MTKKKVPGAGEVHMLYDHKDRLILTQDAVQRTKGEWLFAKYDILNRPVMTGIYPSNKTREELEAIIKDYTGSGDVAENIADETIRIGEVIIADEYQGENIFKASSKIVLQKGFQVNTSAGETFISTINDLTNEEFTGYKEEEETSLIDMNQAKLLTITYYDDYDFSGDGNNEAEYINMDDELNVSPTLFNRLNDQITGTKVRVLGQLNDPNQEKWLTTVSFYDDKRRIIQTQTDNHLEGKDVMTTSYDFSGKVVETYKEHVIDQTEKQTISKKFAYDHVGRVLEVKQNINKQTTDEILTQNSYNEIGELISKELGGGIQEMNYKYNIRGWMTKLNDMDALDDQHLLGFELQYNNASNNAQYNGNIGKMSWKLKSVEQKSNYDYTYDDLNRLTSATFFGAEGEDFSVPTISYDANGNIMSLTRKGLQTTGNYDIIDQLTYSYDGNRLRKVEDAANFDGTEDFKDNIDAAEEYLYDENGNMSKDKNKGIENIEYNHLNLPIKVDMGNGDSLVYIYDAAGVKHAQIVYEAGVETKRTDYQGKFIYESKDGAASQLQLIQHEEGRVVYETDVDGHFVEYEYQYHLKDHLGNVRATFKEEGDIEASQATFEPEQSATEAGYFIGYDGMTTITADLFNHTEGGHTSMRLNGSANANERESFGKSLMIKPGDVIDMEVYAKYFDASESSGWTNVLNTLAAQIAANTAGVISSEASGIGPDAFPFADWTGKDNPSDAPKAYLNYLVFDQNFQLIGDLSGYQQISEAAKENGSDVAHEQLSHSITITETGYIYIYLSNENDVPIDVFFDDFTVTQNHTPIVQKDDYYPFGMTFGSYQRAASTAQRYKFNQGTSDKQFKTERITDLGLNLDMTKFRMYDYALGRFTSVDPLAEVNPQESWTPYQYGYNNPIRYNDPYGDCPWCGALIGAAIDIGFAGD